MKKQSEYGIFRIIGIEQWRMKKDYFVLYFIIRQRENINRISQTTTMFMFEFSPFPSSDSDLFSSSTAAANADTRCVTRRRGKGII